MTSWSSHLIKTSVGLAAAVVLVIAVAGGTYALWNARVNLPGAVITAGNANLTIEGPSGLDTGGLYPGQTMSTEFSVQNTGTVALDLRVDTLSWPSAQASFAQQAFAEALSVSIWPDTGAGCGAVPPESAWTGTFSSDPGELEVTVDPGVMQPMCLTTTLGPNAADSSQGASIDLQLTLGGVQQR